MSSALVTTLPPAAHSASRARRIVEAAVDRGGVGHLIDEAMLIVTELVTNAIVHAGTDIELRVDAGDASLRVEVVDRVPGSLAINRRPPSDSQEGGRGLFLVDALASEWGVRYFTGGKAVWFLLCDAPDDTAVNPARVEPLHALPLDDLPPASRELSWLLGLPHDIEERLAPNKLVAELLRRLVDGLRIAHGWLYVRPIDGGRDWQLVAAHDPLTPAPDADLVRRLAQRPAETVPLPDSTGLAIPLRGREGLLGALVLGMPSASGTLSLDDIAVARLVGARMSVVLREGRVQAGRTRSRGSLALLAEASEMFAGTLDVQLVVTLTSQLLVPRLAEWSAVWTTFDGPPELAAVADSQESRLQPRREALSSDPGRAMVAGLVDDVVDDHPVRLAADAVAAALGASAGTVLAVPLLARRRLLGVLLVGRPAGGSYGPDDVALLSDLARRAALTVDNARLYEERTSIARALQASLLPPVLPSVTGLEFGARYASAGEGNDVGGDFYDVFPLPGERWGIAIGDVCGKGAEAAAITGLARNVMRLLIRDGVAPPQVLQRLNEAIIDLGPAARFCTASLGIVSPDGDGLRVRLSSAGHPPPVLLTRDGVADFVGSNGTLLGVLDEIDVVDDEIRLNPGDSLVFYTDGVTERRDGLRLFGDRLLDSVRAAAGSAADTLARRVEHDALSFGGSAARDDLAVLVLRCHVVRDPARARRPADPLLTTTG